MDFDNTFAPTLSKDSLRILLAAAAQNDWIIGQCDIKTAFLYGPIDHDLHIEQPEGFELKDKPADQYICKLNKALYGLKQAPRCWNNEFTQYMEQLNFQQSKHDKCVFYNKAKTLFVGVYVDDILIFSKDRSMITNFKNQLSAKFEIADLGEASHILGMKVTRTPEGYTLDQETYTKNMLKTFGLQQAKPSTTPGEKQKLTKKRAEETGTDQELYQQKVGSLIYLATCTRPDIAVAVNAAARHVADPSHVHMIAVDKIFRYLTKTQAHGLNFQKGKRPQLLVTYADSDWAGDHDDRKSTSGFVTSLGGNTIAWRSSKQSVVALSSVEAELISAAEAVSYSLWLSRLCLELGLTTDQAVEIKMDSQGAMALASSGTPTRKTKHIEIKHYFITDCLDKKQIYLKYVPSEDNNADVMTKNLDKTMFQTQKNRLKVINCREGVLESEAPEITFNQSDSSKLQGDTDKGSKQPINKGEAVQQKAQQKALQNEEKLQLINPESE